MNNLDLIEIFSNSINSLKRNLISKEDLFTDSNITKALELSEIALLNNELQKEKERLKIINIQEDNIRNGKKKNMGCPWTLELRHKLIIQFKNGISIEKIADGIERTIGSIEYQLVKEGLIREEDTTYSKNKSSKPASKNDNLSKPISQVNSPSNFDDDYPA